MNTHRITVMGAGSWGTALAAQLAGNGHEVTLWCRRDAVAEGINQHHHNPDYVPEARLPDNLRATTDIADAVAAGPDLMLWTVPSQATRDVLVAAAPALSVETLVVSATKGVEVDSLALMTDVFADVLGVSVLERMAVLSGPGFADEVVRKAPTAVAVAAWNPAVSEQAQDWFASSTFRVYTNSDPVGTQVGGALKNVVAIAAGVVQGLGFGPNTQAVLITRGLAEITRLGLAMDAQESTFSGLSGVGDLVLTCTGGLSRNRQVGVGLGEGKSLESILAGMGMVAEGVKTTAAAHALARQYGVDMPIVHQVHRVLFDGVAPAQALNALMGRPQKREAALLSEG